MAVVEHQRGQAGRGEALGVGGQALVVDGREAVAEDDGAGRALGVPQPGGDVAAECLRTEATVRGTLPGTGPDNPARA